jgi:hypothetical protein
VSGVRVRGLEEYRQALTAISDGLEGMQRVVLDQALSMVVGWARPRIPRRSGDTAGSLQLRHGATLAGVEATAVHFGWLDYGGRVGRALAVQRRYEPGGRYLYPGLRVHHDDITEAMRQAYTDLVRRAGLEVS